jgi:hypothetical protein
MTFINWAMLIALAGMAIPVLIHLLNRRKATVMAWGAMRFLQEAMASQNRRIRLEEIVLMALRCLLVALLVLAMARPLLPSRSNIPWAVVLPSVMIAAMLLGLAAAMWSSRRARWWLLAAASVLLLVAVLTSLAEHWLQLRRWASPGGGNDVVIVIDGSASMALRVDGKTNFARAVQEARSVVDACRPSDAVALLVAAQVPRRIIGKPTTSRKAVHAALDSLQEPVGGSMRLIEALHEARDSLVAGSNVGKKIIVIADAQRVGWDAANVSRWSALAEVLRSDGEAGMFTAPQLVCHHLRLPEKLINAAVADVGLSRPVVGTDREVEIHVKVANTGTSPITPRAVTLSIDDAEPITRKLGEIPIGSAETVAFPHRFASPGRHLLRAGVECDDEVGADNAATRAVDAVEQVNVLVVDGAPSPRELDSPGELIALALSPREPPAGGGSPARGVSDDGNGERPCLMRPTVVAAADVASVGDLAAYSLVVLANVERLPRPFAGDLARFVRDGGGLLIAPGDRAQGGGGDGASEPFYNSWRTPRAFLVAPAMLRRRRVLTDEPARPAVESFTHACLAKLPPYKVERTLVHAYWSLGCDDDPDVRVAALLDSGEPLLVERRLGKGYVLMTALSMDKRDSNLPTQRCFVPLMQEMALYLASPARTKANIDPGEELVMDLLSGAPAAPAGAGLRGEYFDGRRFERRRLARTDETIDFHWGDGSPDRSLGGDDFCVRWTGQIRPRYSEKYTFRAFADDGVRLWIGGKKVVEHWGDGNQEYAGTIALEAGRKYDMRLDYFEHGGQAAIRLFWSSRSQRRQIVPKECLFASRSPADELAARLRGIETVTVVTPSNRSLTATVDRAASSAHLRFGATQEAGVYRILVPEALREFVPAAHGKDKGLAFVAVADAREGDLAALGEADLAEPRAILQERGVEMFVARSSGEVVASVSRQTPGDELWKYLAVAAGLALLAEIALTRWIATRRRTHAARPVRLGGRAIDLRTFRSRAREMLARTTPQQQPASRS